MIDLLGEEKRQLKNVELNSYLSTQSEMAGSIQNQFMMGKNKAVDEES